MITQQILCLHNVTDQRSLRGYTLRASSGKPEGGPFFRLGRPSEGASSFAFHLGPGSPPPPPLFSCNSVTQTAFLKKGLDPMLSFVYLSSGGFRAPNVATPVCLEIRKYD